MPYDQIVFIGYAIDTTPDASTPVESYRGITPAADDIAARCQLLASVLETARANLPPPSSPPARTLYVFMIPEFFFRGPTGAYAMDDVQTAIAALQALVSDARWSDWVFEFGTIVGQWITDDPSAPVQICNFALTQQGGLAAQGSDGARAVVKELKSGVDFIAGSASPGSLLLGEVDHQPGADSGGGKERQQASYDGAGIFDLAGLTWGTEICLDHLEGRLQRSPQMPGESLVQVQLVPSCGADIMPPAMIAQPGGYAFNVDGWRDGQAHTRLVRIGATQPDLPRRAPVPIAVTQVTLPQSPPRTVTIGQIYAGGAGVLSVYEPVPAPPALSVPGHTASFTWRASASPSWTFTFFLIFDPAGQFSLALCTIHNTEIDFGARRYFLPINFALTFPIRPNESAARTGSIRIELRTAGVDRHAIYGKINVPGCFDVQRNTQVPGFNFEGELMRFGNDQAALPTIQTIW